MVVERGKPVLLVGTRWADGPIDRNLAHLKAKFPSAEARQVSATGGKDYVSPAGIRVAPATRVGYPSGRVTFSFFSS